jgi:hypothetical protein
MNAGSLFNTSEGAQQRFDCDVVFKGEMEAGVECHLVSMLYLKLIKLQN